jgi:putative ABC transport system permease protein
MSIVSRWRAGLRAVLRRGAVERDLDRELADWVDELARRYEAQGVSPREARRRALVETGGVEQVKEEVRARRAGAGLDALLLDLRYAVRGLRKAPGLTAVIALTLALGIGANTAIFSVVHALLIRPLPYRGSDRMVFVWLDRHQVGYPRGPMSGPDLQDLRAGSRTVADFGAIWASGAITLTGEAEPEQLRSAFVTTNFFHVLGAESSLGRTFRAQDSEPGADPTILLGWELFERRFGADPSIVGRKISVNDRLVTVVGVMPKDFRLLLPPDSSVPDHLQAWIPFWPKLEGGPRRNLFLRVIGRMRPGITAAQAGEDIAAIGQRLTRELGTERTFTTVALQDDRVRDIRGPLLALFAGVGILLMIACVNVAGLLIARAATRSRETALRLALGASRGRLLRQSLVEGLLLALLGAGAGVLAGSGGLHVLLALAPDSLGRLAAARVDGTVLAFVTGIALLWGIVFSLAPLAEVLRADAGASLHPRWRTTATPIRYRGRAALAVVQIALSLTLLVGAGLLMRTFIEVVRVDPGFRADRELTFRMLIPEHRYPTTQSVNLFESELRRRLCELPGVTGAGAISHLPYDDLPNWGLPYGLTAPLQLDAPMADARAISTGTFEMLGVRLLEGRFFTDEDQNPKQPVTIVDDMLARRLWPNRSALGREFFTHAGSQNARVSVVGVVRHLKLRSLVDDLSPQMFVPWRIVQRNPVAWVVRAEGDPAALAPAVRTAVAGIDPRVPIYEVRPMQRYVEAARSTRRFTMLLAAAFGATALALTCVGIYGVLAYAVAARRHEFGVRRALGADAGQVRRAVLREGLAFAAAGCGAGLAGGAATSVLLQRQLYAVRPHDPITYAAAVALILTSSAVACWIPAHRATRISPIEALRTE